MKLVLALLLTSSILYSQNDSVCRFNIPEINIRQYEMGKLVTYGFDNDDNLFLLSDSLLQADPDKYKYSVKLNDINSFSIRNGFSTFGGAKYGGFIGGGIGLVVGIMNALVYRPNFAEIALVLPGLAAAGFLGGAIIGGFLGSFNPKYDVYGVLSNDMAVRKKQLRKILYEHDLNRRKRE
jgi:hypothetical protein